MKKRRGSCRLFAPCETTAQGPQCAGPATPRRSPRNSAGNSEPGRPPSPVIPEERVRWKRWTTGGAVEEPLHQILRRYFTTKEERSLGVKLRPKAPLFVTGKETGCGRAGPARRHHIPEACGTERPGPPRCAGPRPAAHVCHPPRRGRCQRHRDPCAARPREPEHVAGLHRRHRQRHPPGGPGQPHLPGPSRPCPEPA